MTWLGFLQFFTLVPGAHFFYGAGRTRAEDLGTLRRHSYLIVESPFEFVSFKCQRHELALEMILSKEVDRWLQAVGQIYLWLPSELCLRQRNIWLPLFGVVLGERHVDQL